MNRSVTRSSNRQMTKTATTDTRRRTRTRTKIGGDKRTRRPSRSAEMLSRWSRSARAHTPRSPSVVKAAHFTFFFFHFFIKSFHLLERIRRPPVHRANLPAAVWVCSGSAEDQQSYSAAEKYDGFSSLVFLVVFLLRTLNKNTKIRQGWVLMFYLISDTQNVWSVFKKWRS